MVPDQVVAILRRPANVVNLAHTDEYRRRMLTSDSPSVYSGIIDLTDLDRP